MFPPLQGQGSLDRPISRAGIHDIVRRLAHRAGLDGDYGSHSPRAGFVTDGINRRIPREHIQRYGGWTNAKSLDAYYRRANIWDHTNPAISLSQVGLAGR